MTVKIYDDKVEFFTEYNRLKPFIDKAVKWSDEPENNLVNDILNRKLLLVSIDNAFALISINQDEENKFCHYRLCGGQTGSMQDIMKSMETVEAFAKEKNCTHMSLIGRKGWIKFLTKYGFEAEPYGNQTKYIKVI